MINIGYNIYYNKNTLRIIQFKYKNTSSEMKINQSKNKLKLKNNK
jgi:hypothetical protein